MGIKTNTIPNWITLGRLILYLLVLGLLLGESQVFKPMVLPLFIIVFLMDKLDGWVARKLNQTSGVGISFDRAADRIIVTTLSLSYVYFYPNKLILILLLINIMRDFLVGGLRQLSAEEKIVMSKHLMGKLKFVVENLYIILMILIISIPTAANYIKPLQQMILWLLLLSCILGWWSFGIYVKEILGKND